MRPHPNSRQAWTLVELIVVVAIIAVLIALVSPSLHAARQRARLSACASNQRQLLIAAAAYASAEDGRIPAGPDLPFPFLPDRRWTEFATGWVWIGAIGRFSAHGLLFDGETSDPRIAFCPDDRGIDVSAQIRAIGTPEDAFGTYMYRHLDQTTRVQIDDLGRDEAGLAATALFCDMQSDGPTPALQRRTHDGAFVNIAYAGGHVLQVRNGDDRFSFTPQDFAAFPHSFARRIDQILITADFAETGDPAAAPRLP
jgi:prepilin-type processing-associated H-X9-DG protein